MSFELSVHKDSQLIYKFQNQPNKKDFVKLNNIATLGLVTLLAVNSCPAFINKILIPKENLYGFLQVLTTNGTPMTFKNYLTYFKDNFK